MTCTYPVVPFDRRIGFRELQPEGRGFIEKLLRQFTQANPLLSEFDSFLIARKKRTVQFFFQGLDGLTDDAGADGDRFGRSIHVLEAGGRYKVAKLFESHDLLSAFILKKRI